MSNRYHRQSTLINQEAVEETPITIIGAGGIGSFLTLFLSKMGARNIEVWDFDDVEEHNLSSQLYGPSHVGMSKVDSLSEIIFNLEGFYLQKRNEEFQRKNIHEGILILAVDSIEARRKIVENCGNPDFIIDGRMGAEVAEIYSFCPSNEKELDKYIRTLHSSDEVAVVPCTERSTVYCASGLNGFIAGIVKQVIHNRTPPFRTVLDFVNNHVFSEA